MDADHFLTVVTWPPDLAPPQIGRLLEEQAGLDAPTLTMRAKAAAPIIVGRFPESKAVPAVRALREAGGDGMAQSLADLESLGPTHKIKDVRIIADGIVFEPWRGGPRTLAPDEVEIVIRAKLSETKKTPAATSGNAFLGRAALGSIALWSVGGAYGLGAGLYLHARSRPAEIERTLRTSDKLDIHLADRTVFQVDGDKFGYQVLGDRRGHADSVNMDRMCELFVHLAPNAIVDPWFTTWKAPAGHDRIRLPSMRINDDDPTFAFYSRWAATLYRHVTGRLS